MGDGAFFRDHDRFVVDGTALIILPNNERKGSMIKDISARGVCVITHSALTLHEKVRVIIYANIFKEPLEKDATVVACKEAQEKGWEVSLDFGLDNKINISP